MRTIGTKLAALFLFAMPLLGQQQFHESQVQGLVSDLAARGLITSIQQEGYIYAADTGAANAYVVTLSPAPTVVAGSVVVFKAANANTSASTLAVNGGAATAIKKNVSAALASGDIASGQLVAVIYDGTNWQVISPLPSASGMVYPSGSGIPIVVSGTSWGTTVAAPTGTVVGTTDTQTLTNKTLDGVSPATMAFVDPASSIQTQLNAKTGTIASGTSALGTSAIASASCATVVTTTATGTASTDAIMWNPNASIKAVTGYIPSTSGGLTIAAYPTANNVNFDVCNWTSSSITPGAITLNWRVVR